MNVSIILLVIGVFLLFIKQTAWAGIGLIGMGIVTYFFIKKQPDYSYHFDSELRQKFQRISQQPGFGWNMREFADPTQRTPDMPNVDDGTFSLPMPMGELSNMMDFRHKTKIK